MLKHLLAVAAAVVTIFACAATTKNVQGTPDGQPLIAEYIHTEYWGEDQTCKFSENATYTGRRWKTFRPPMSEDLPWVIAETKDSDRYHVKLVWTMSDNNALGVCFDWLDTEAPIDTCGIMVFDSLTSLWEFVMTYEGDGSNVRHLIKSGLNLPVTDVLYQRDKQVKHSENRKIGDAYDICDDTKLLDPEYQP